jgi:Fe-S cluster biogenesis protein NfuA
MEAATETLQGETETERQIIQLLDEYVKPAVEGDGGAISFRSFQEGVVHLELRGSCSGCPSSTLTLKQGIQNLLTRMVPEVKEVVAVNM